MSVIYVWDERWPGSFAFSHKRAYPNENVFGFTAKRTDALPRIVSQIRGLSQGKGQIRLLRLCAHGNTAFLQLGRDNLTLANANQMRALRGYFSGEADARIEIHGCGVASATDIVKRDGAGRVIRDTGGHLACTPGFIDYWNPAGSGMLLLRTVRRAAGVAVLAGINCQIADPNYMFEGPVVNAV